MQGNNNSEQEGDLSAAWDPGCDAVTETGMSPKSEE